MFKKKTTIPTSDIKIRLAPQGMSDEDNSGKNHFQEGRRQLERGTQRFLEEGGKKLDYYRENRSELIENFSKRIGDPKKPATSGIIVLAPIFVVFLVVAWLFDKIAKIPGTRYFNISQYFNIGNVSAYVVDQTFKLSMLLLVSAIVVTGVGRFVRTKTGFELEKLLDAGFNRVPFLGSIYNITKVTTETVLGGAEDLREPVKINFQGYRLTGFRTGNRAPDGKEVIFVPTSPNITSGFVVEVDTEDVIETGETSEQALTRVLSAGFGDSRPGEDTDGKG